MRVLTNMNCSSATQRMMGTNNILECRGRIAVYYLYSQYPEERVPYATVAVEEREDGLVNRAYAYCSFKDQFNKKVGRQIALQRLYALQPSTVRRFGGALRSSDSPACWGSAICEVGCPMTSRELRIFKKEKA